MPIDVRKLIFSKTELRDTFEDYCRRKGLVNAMASIENYELVTLKSSDLEKESLSVTVNFVSPNPKRPITADLIEDEIVEALVTACKQLNIPLPRKGHKYIKPYKEGLMMTMGLNEAAVRAMH